jgi:diguanylate cyclase (GGDEF)-like protein
MMNKDGWRLKPEYRRHLLTLWYLLLAAGLFEIFVLFPTNHDRAIGMVPGILGLDYPLVIGIAAPGLLFLGAILCWALAGGKKNTALRASFSRGGNARLVLLVTWFILSSLAALMVGASPVLLLIYLVAAALYGWRKPWILAFGALIGSASVAIVDFVVRGHADAISLAIAAAAAGLCIATGAIIRDAVLRSTDRLDSLERENKKLWELSYRDGLTGLFNRRYSQELGGMLFARAKRYGEHLHVLMLDIDHFKNVNDKLGHPVGDEVLKNIADILATQVRASDVVTRYGGEEFLVFLIQTEPEVAQFIANRIRDAVASHAFPDVPWQLTISIGVAGIKADDTLGELVDRADKYLYASKHGGRNRVSGF